MTNQLDRRLRKLEAASKPSSRGRFRLLIVPHGSSAEAEAAKLDNRRADDELWFVRLVRPSDVPSSSEVRQ